MNIDIDNYININILFLYCISILCLFFAVIFRKAGDALHRTVMLVSGLPCLHQNPVGLLSASFVSFVLLSLLLWFWLLLQLWRRSNVLIILTVLVPEKSKIQLTWSAEYIN